MRFRCSTTLFMLLITAGPAMAGEINFKTQEIDKSLGVGYAVSLVDVNDDQRRPIRRDIQHHARQERHRHACAEYRQRVLPHEHERR